MDTQESNLAHSPPRPPPLPPPPPQNPEQKISSIALKTRRAPPEWAFEGNVINPAWDFLTPPSGTYFFYGTLQDDAMLGEILDLPSKPVLRPAHGIGYELRLWDQYPALVDGPGGATVEGSAFDAPDEAAAKKLVSYETKNYRPEPCNIRFREGDEQHLVDGYTFKSCGNAKDLSDGLFHLDVWLKRMGRRPRF